MNAKTSAGTPNGGIYESRPRYETIRRALQAAIGGGRLPAGLVLVEGPLAQIFGTSRAPVRQALELLCQDGAIRRFDGRGYLVAGLSGSGADDALEPKRLRLTKETLGLAADEEVVDQRSAGERVYGELERDISTCVVFGHFRIREPAAAKHFQVSRLTVREALVRLRDRGLLQKDPYAEWHAGPLTARAVAENYQLRVVLEPVALRECAPGLERAELAAMLRTVEVGLDAPHPGNGAIGADRVDHDLHVRCLRCLTNRRMLEVIRLSQMPLVVNELFFATLRLSPDRAILVEHRRVLNHLLTGAFDLAAQALAAHLRRAAQRTSERLKVFSVLPKPKLPKYLVKIG